MGRMHSRGKGISASALPYKRTPPSWLKISSQDVEENICKFAKKGLTPSQIGVILRDSHGIAQVRSVTGSKILRILKAHGLAPEIPEDLYHLIKKAVAIRKHLERNRKDKDSKFRLILVESRIHRLARYYKKTKKLPPLCVAILIPTSWFAANLQQPALSLLKLGMWGGPILGESGFDVDATVEARLCYVVLVSC
ncbi:40S ribosomal protein S13 [Gossypium australe]|uniref:40S ribosomal protein S13 n=1 Tax=Gossypium australe TaxID=47621 RepID=A0A5B6URC0_9ROSI|nr:40S ribosomal protein S13 [Gossypium australe]